MAASPAAAAARTAAAEAGTAGAAALPVVSGAKSPAESTATGQKRTGSRQAATEQSKMPATASQ